MTENTNDWVKELLSWHGHDRGGVHVPFQNNNPLGQQPIVTSLLLRLRQLASDIAKGQETPRWIFLIGGPGNGKSEAVQDFLGALDNELHLEGQLINFLSKAFSPQPLVPRRVQVLPSDLKGYEEFHSKIARLIVVQDATATDDALGDSAKQFVDDILDLLTTTDKPAPIFVACANRGLLARSLKEARISDAGDEVIDLLEKLITASSLGVGTLVSERTRPSCWPLYEMPGVACWPLDLESLLLKNSEHVSAIEQILSAAITSGSWEDKCIDCSSKTLCPFLQNVTWLRDAKTRENLLKILRRGELFLGQRWNFRDVFSLIAELIIGQWTDFKDFNHPCEWVHDQVSNTRAEKDPDQINSATLSIVRRLYPHALFPITGISDQDEAFVTLLQGHVVTLSIFNAWNRVVIGSVKSIRERLLREHIALDPASYTPWKPEHVLRTIEDEYSQSIQQGNLKLTIHNLAESEKQLSLSFEKAEKEWNSELLGRNASQAVKAVSYLRRQVAFIVKRSVGVRLGNHAYEDYLASFENTMYDQVKLNDIAPSLKKLLGDDKFRFNLMESFGQPQAEDNRSSTERLISLISNPPGIRVYPASQGSDRVPRHDVPFFIISNTGYPVPMTFDFYLALQLRQAGCTGSSLPASVRAAVDRVRQQIAGSLCRKKDYFVDRTATISVDKYNIVLGDEESEPVIEG